MKYAPIIIPTLNRYEHLERLIQSLQKNGWAKYTELYISIDYPPAERYQAGYSRVCKYLAQAPEGFKNVFIFKQTKNLGPYQNGQFLLKKVFKGNDRFIILEDDNEVSGNFIEYMDKGLERFEGDQSVLCVCANNEVILTRQNEHPDITDEKVRKLRYVTYGQAIWKDRYREIIDKCRSGYFERIGRNPFMSMKLFFTDQHLYYRFVSDIVFRKPIAYSDDIVYPIDIVWNIYAALINKTMIVPQIPKIRNYGFDGSGARGTRFDVDWNPPCQILDDRSGFEFHEVLTEKETKKEAHLIDIHSRPGSRHMLMAVCMHFLYMIGGKRIISLNKRKKIV